MKCLVLGILILSCLAQTLREMRQGFGDEDDFMDWYVPMEPWKNEASSRSGQSNESQEQPSASQPAQP